MTQRVNVYFRPLIPPKAITRPNMVTLLHYLLYIINANLAAFKITVGRIRGRKYTLTFFEKKNNLLNYLD